MTGSRCMRRAAIRRLMLAGCGGKDVLTLLWEDIDLEGPLANWVKEVVARGQNRRRHFDKGYGAGSGPTVRPCLYGKRSLTLYTQGR